MKLLFLCVLSIPLVVNQLYAVDVNFDTKVNHLYGKSANKTRLTSLSKTKSIFYIFPDTVAKVALTRNDSLQADSNYLPVTASSMKSEVKYNARDSIIYLSGEKTATLFGDAKINFENYEMKSARIRIDLNKNLVNATGELDSAGQLSNTPVFKQGDDEYKIEEVTFNYTTKKGLMREFRTKEGDGYIRGERVKRDAENNFYIRDSYYTTCDEHDPHFAINAKKLKVIPGKKVITGPANMSIAGIRTPLFVPFGIFPLKRGQQSGIIIPSYGNAAGRGFFLRQGGYYFGMGERADLALMGDIYANGSWLLGARMNYSKRYNYNGMFSGNYAYNKNGLPEDKNYTEFNSFQIAWMHNMDSKAKPGTSFRADVNLSGGNYLAYNTYNTNTSFNNNVNSSINYSRSMKKGKYNLATSARVSQNISTHDISMTLPDLTFNVASFQPFKPRWKPVAEKWWEKTSINYSGTMQNIITTKDTLLFKPRNEYDMKMYLDTVMKTGARHGFSAQNSFNLFKYYTVSVSGDYNETWTMKTVEKTYDPENKKVNSENQSGFERGYQYSFRGGISTRFYGLVQFKKGKLTAVRHVINPDLSFMYSPDFSKESYGFYKSVQTDSIGNTTQYSIFENSLYGGPGRGKQGNINFGLDNNLEIKWKKGKDTAQKVEKVKIFESLRASGYYNIFADSLKLSTIPISWRTTLFKTINLNGGATLDPYVNVVTESNGSKYYQRINKFYLDEQGKLGVITTANLGIGAGLNPEMFKGKNQERKDAKKKDLTDHGYAEVNMPWSLMLNYTIGYDYRSKIDPNATQFVQTLTFSGTLNPSKNWALNFTSGYDFKLNKISHLGIDLRRQLHCWEFTFNWTPLSAYGTKYFIFNIHVKSPVLQDLKVPKRKDWFDNRRI